MWEVLPTIVDCYLYYAALELRLTIFGGGFILVTPVDSNLLVDAAAAKFESTIDFGCGWLLFLVEVVPREADFSNN